MSYICIYDYTYSVYIRRPLQSVERVRLRGIPPLPPIQQPFKPNPIQSGQPADKPTSLQGSRIQAASLQTSGHPGIQASKPLNLQDWSLPSFFRGSSPALKAATGCQDFCPWNP